MRRRNSRRILAIAAPVILAGVIAHAHREIETELRLSQTGTPEIRVSAKDGRWQAVTEAPVSFSFLIEASAARGAIRDVAYGVPGVHVGDDGMISAGGPAARRLQVEPTTTVQRWARLEVRGDALPVYGNAAIAACNDLIAEGASTTDEHRTEVTARARAAMAVDTGGWQGLMPLPVVDTATIDVTIGVVCNAEEAHERSSGAIASGNGSRHG